MEQQLHERQEIEHEEEETPMTRRHKAVLAFASIQFILATVCLICGILEFAWEFCLRWASHGLWSGAYLLLTSILGIYGGSFKIRWLEITFMATSIFAAACLLPTALGLAITELGVYRGAIEWSCPIETFRNKSEFLIVNAVLLGTLSALIVITILSAAYACFTVCVSCGGGIKEDSDEMAIPVKRRALPYSYATTLQLPVRPSLETGPTELYGVIAPGTSSFQHPPARGYETMTSKIILTTEL